MPAKVSEDKLRKAAPHVAHDINMLKQAYDHRDNSFAYTAWFVHCRSVMAFFDPPSQQTDDIVALQFFEDPETWTAVLSQLDRPGSYCSYEKAANKLAAHLTFARISYQEKGTVPSKDITDYLLGVSRLFVNQLPPKRQVWFGGLQV